MGLFDIFACRGAQMYWRIINDLSDIFGSNCTGIITEDTRNKKQPLLKR